MNREDVRRFYDWFGSWQDVQPHENRPVDVLISHGSFERARRVFEFGCGTGRLAKHLLTHVLPNDSRYVGVDISATMVGIAGSRLRTWADRALVKQVSGVPILNEPSRQFDRFVATYVLDLLTDTDATQLLREARRVLEPGGCICLASLTFGDTWLSRSVVGVWQAVYAVYPMIVGGCRPVRLLNSLQADRWCIVYHEIVSTSPLPSEVVIARA